MYFKALTLFWVAFILQHPLTASAATILPEDSSAAAVYSYFDIEENNGEASMTTDSFKAHVKEITSGSYNILHLPDLVQAQKNGRSLPRRSIALTFDSIDRNFIKTIAPLLLKADIPFTLFISAGQIDRKSNDVSWDDIRSLAKDNLVTIGMSAYIYAHNSEFSKEALTADLNQARARIREELKLEPKLFAYPYGEYSAAYRNLIEQQGFAAAFGQQSGVASKDSDLFTLPRFTITEELSDLDRFRMTSDALPFPVSDIEPASMILKDNPPFPGFTVPAALSASDLKSMTCFASGIGKLDVTVLGKNRVELRFPKAFDDDRGRLNCTLPVKISEDGVDIRWRWLGFLYSIPGAY
jgi:peptidoglycan/xylan/chitin deacetylase (PgdA/CDA1 family)